MKRSEEYKTNLRRNQRNFNTDPWNKQLLEITDTQAFDVEFSKASLEEYRNVRHSPVFTNGEHICLIATYHKPGDSSGERSEYEIELYTADTWEFVRSYRLNFEPEESIGLTPAQQAKILEQTDSVKLLFSNQTHLLRSVCALNATTFAIGSHGSLYLFDLTTGRRYSEVLKIPRTCGGYNPYTNTFWYFVEDRENIELKSFTIENFNKYVSSTQTVEKNQSDVHLKQFSQQITTTLLETQDKTATYLSSRDMKTFIQKLCLPKQLKSQLKSMNNETVDESLYLIMYVLSKGCDNTDIILKEMSQLQTNSNENQVSLQSKLFRSENSVSVRATFVDELLKAMNKFNSFISEPKEDENILQQYQLGWLIKLTHRFVKCLDKLDIKLSEIVDDQDSRTSFTQIITEVTQK